jgi:hypothetical protein
MTTQYDTNASAIDTKLCMDGWFVLSMPDLNQSNFGVELSDSKMRISGLNTPI